MDLNNEVHGNRLIQDTTTNPKSRGGLLPLMMESVAEVLVKEERRFRQRFPFQSSPSDDL
jgi:hypothetical protein